MVTTKLFRNTTEEDINVIGIGVIPANDQISITSDGHAPVNLLNYPGVVEVVEAETNGTEVPELSTPEASVAPQTQIEVQDGEQTNETL